MLSRSRLTQKATMVYDLFVENVSKNKSNRLKCRAGRVTPVVEHLPSKFKALSSTSQGRRKRERERERGSKIVEMVVKLLICYNSLNFILSSG
jgi:hypothetical protein